jgi:putative restriction endonuclease
MSPYKGIFRARAQTGPAALSITTSFNSPYRDRATADGWIYSYRAGDVNQPDNRALRAAYADQAPLVYFQGTRPGYYKPLFPWFVDADDPVEMEVHVSPGQVVLADDALLAVPLDDPIERLYAFRNARVRLHQTRFRGRVLPAYRDRCAICSLKEPRLLDAAHIVGDLEEHGEPTVSNGVSLCSIHHRAYDEHLVGISADYGVRVSRRLLDDEDGPMLELLKGFDGATITLPERRAWRPDRERLELRFQRFLAASGA